MNFSITPAPQPDQQTKQRHIKELSLDKVVKSIFLYFFSYFDSIKREISIAIFLDNRKYSFSDMKE